MIDGHITPTSPRREIEGLRHRIERVQGALHEGRGDAAANERELQLLRHLEDRRLLEETAQAMIDAGLGGMAFGEKWQRAQMNAEIPEEEREAAAEAAHLDEIGDYLNSAATVLGVDLMEQERPPGIREVMSRETARASVHRFENSADTGDASGDAA